MTNDSSNVKLLAFTTSSITADGSSAGVTATISEGDPVFSPDSPFSALIGDDASSNTNDFTHSGIDFEDIVPDSPSNNFATFNSLDTYSYTLSEGNLKAVNSTNNRTVRATTLLESGKWYWELRRHNTANSDGNIYILVGVAKNGTNIQDNPYTSAGNYTYTSHTGVKYNNNTSASYGDSWRDAGDIVGIAFDADNGAIWFSKNGTWQNSATTSEIAAGTTTNAAYTGLTDLAGYIPIFARTGGTAANEMDVNFGQNPSFNGELIGSNVGTESDGNAIGAFKYAPPSGFLAICSSNFTDPELGPNKSEQATDNFTSLLWTGNGSDGRSITGVGFDPDWVWIKSRNKSTSHLLNDTVRGANKSLFSEGDTAETANNGGGYLSAFVTDGFSVTSGSSGDDAVNDGTGTYVSWNWKAGGTPTANNSESSGDVPTAGSVKIDGVNLATGLQGSLPATRLSANTKAGFSIVTYTGNNSDGATVAHGLTQKLDALFIKKRADNSSSGNTGYWIGQHVALTTDPEGDEHSFTLSSYSNGAIYLNASNAESSYTFDNQVGGNTDTFVAYCFHNVEGFSKFGTFAGNSNADGTFVYCGFKPARIWLKRYDGSTVDWTSYDLLREGFNVENDSLRLNAAATEQADDDLDILSNGFKMRRNMANNQGDVLFFAWADSPFKYANAR